MAHRNSIEDPGYRQHLERLVKPMKEHLLPGWRGVDFGCGPSPVLATLLEERGVRVDSFDPLFFPAGASAAPFDFLVSTEVVEHFQEPLLEFQRLTKLVKNEGIIGIMTMLREGTRRNGDWWYLRDSTHRVFYSFRTFEVLASELNWIPLRAEKDVLLFKIAP